jgi:predicted component of type VI protein secretion system
MPRIIITVPEKNAQPYRFSLNRESVSIGRGSDNDIVVDSGSVSVKHAEMRRIEGGYELGDAGSTNGIKHRGVRHDKIALVSGMSLRLGEVSFDFTLTDEELGEIARERPASDIPAQKEKEEVVAGEPDAEAPKRKLRPAAPYKPVAEAAGLSFGMIVLFLVLAAAAFATGLSIRHQKETGEPLIKAIVNKGDRVQQAPSAEAPAK